MNKLFLFPVLAAALVFSTPAISHADETGMRKIEENQEKILQALAEIKSELQIVKVRVTSR